MIESFIDIAVSRESLSKDGLNNPFWHIARTNTVMISTSAM